MDSKQPRLHNAPSLESDEGFMLLGLIVAIAIMLLLLGLAAPRVAQELRRDHEVEAIHRGNQYVRGIQLYYKKLGHYPGSIEQLENTNRVRYLRQRYVDPITGKDDWRLIPPGQNKTTVKGFFGEPLSAISASSLGSAAGMASPGMGTSPGPGGPSGGPGIGPGPNGQSGPGGGINGPAASGGASGGASPTGQPNPLGSNQLSSQSASTFTGSSTGAPFMGVGLNTTGESLTTLNEQTTYDAWEFLYDPRIELLRAKAALNGANAGSVSGSSVGQAPGASGALPTAGANPNTPATPPPQP